jgi:pantoate--beta-alanine ligase
VREPDGLAMSSRNVRLTPEQRAAAPVLRRALLAARARYEAGERDGEALRAAMREVLATEPLAARVRELRRSRPRSRAGRFDGPALLSMAVRFGAVRLIDNEPLP